MSKLAIAELVQLRELMQLETLALDKSKAVEALIKDDELKILARSGIQASENRLKAMQKFVKVNDLSPVEV